MKTISILGATGSIGHSTLDVVSRHPERFRLYAVTANTQVDKMVEVCKRYQPEPLGRARHNSGKTLHGHAPSWSPTPRAEARSIHQSKLDRSHRIT